MTTVCVLVAEETAISQVLAVAAGLGDVTVMVAGPPEVAAQLAAAAGCPVGRFAADLPAEALVPAVAAAIRASGADVLLAADRGAERTLLGQVAAMLAAPALAGVTAAAREGDSVVVTRTGLNGLAELDEVVATPLALIVAGSGRLPSAGPGVLTELPADASYPVSIVGSSPAVENEVDLAGASRVVGVGRGLKAAADLPLVERLATALGATVACSRPIAEGVGWLPRDRYLGVSGKTIAPDLYLALGISGQVQHMVGVRGARVVVAVNADRNAPIFAECDFGIVGDLYQVVPAIIGALQGEPQ